MSQNIVLMSRVVHSAGLVVLILLIGACSGGEGSTTTTPTPVHIVKQLATLGPTPTLNATQEAATRMAVPATPTSPTPTEAATPTPYVGVFIGEVAVDPLAPIEQLDPMQFSIPPTQPSAQDTVRLRCQIERDPIFGDDWRQQEELEDRLRCPIQVSFGFEGQTQVFERGAMYYRPDTGEMWAITSGNSGGNERYWYVDQPPDAAAPTTNAPAGLFTPSDVFGALWSDLPEIRDALGFAVQEPTDTPINIQRYDGGTLLLDAAAGQVFVLLLNGDAYGPYAGNVPTESEEAP